MKRTIEMILMTLLIVLAAAFVGSALMSCSSDDDNNVDDNIIVEENNDDDGITSELDTLLLGKWTLIELKDGPAWLGGEEQGWKGNVPSPYVVEFREDGTISIPEECGTTPAHHSYTFPQDPENYTSPFPTVLIDEVPFGYAFEDGKLKLHYEGAYTCDHIPATFVFERYKYKLAISISDKEDTYSVSDPVCWTDGLTSNYKSPSFLCKIDDAPGLESLYIHYKYYEVKENTNNFYLEDINVGDILDLDNFMAELFYPFVGFGYNRNTYVATSGKIEVIGKSGEGKNLTFNLLFIDLTFTETSRIESGPRPLPQPYIVNGLVTFKHTDKYYN